jgi:hypothetical protein
MPRLRVSKATLFITLLLLFVSAYIFFPLTSQPHPPSIIHPASSLEYANDGLVKGWAEIHERLKLHKVGKRERKRLKSIKDRHPIFDLIEQGKATWQDLLARSAHLLLPLNQLTPV